MTQQLLPMSIGRRDLVIEAGAGTGKTTAIVVEVLQLLLRNPSLSPDRIVLITFTEKAAGELGERVRDALVDLESTFDSEQPRWPSEGEPILVVRPEERAAFREACRRHLQQVDRIRSQTIHSFCQSILSLFPWKSDIGPQFTVMQEFQRARFTADVFDRWVDEETHIQPTETTIEQWEILFDHFEKYDFIARAIDALVKRRDLLAAPINLGGFEDIAPALTRALHDIRSADAQTVAQVNDESSARAIAWLRENEPPASTSLREWADYFAPVNRWIADANLQKKNPLKEQIKFLRDDSTIRDRLLEQRTAEVLCETACRFIERLSKEKRLESVMDFDDLLIETDRLLRDEEIASELRRRYDAIFVDEFQDTDRLQASIVDRLTHEAQGRPAGGALTIVGDPKQSIYAFRRADPETYGETVRRLLEEGAVERRLTGQYRSDPRLVESLNAMFRRLFSRPSERGIFRPQYQALAPQRPERDTPAPPIRFIAVSQPYESPRESEAEAIAAWIENNRDRSGDDLRRFTLLFSRFTEIADYLAVFERRGIDYLLPPRTPLLRESASVELLTVLRAIAIRDDRAAVVSAARTTYFALTDDEIAAWFVDRDNEAATSRYRWFLGELERFRGIAKRSTITETIDAIVEWSESDLLHRLVMRGDESLAVLERFRDLAIEFDQRGGGSLRRFVDEMIRRRENFEDIPPLPLDESKNAIRIFTVHGAKGLEFDTVILPELGARAGRNELHLYSVDEVDRVVMRGGPTTLAAHAVRCANYTLAEIEKERGEAELARLFYVAVTRAKHDVVFVTSKSQRSGFWKCLGAIFPFDASNVDGWFPATGCQVKSVQVGDATVPVAFERVDIPEQASYQVQRLRSESLSAVVAQSPRPVVETPTIAEEPLSRGEIIRMRAGAKNRSRGILLHRVLEVWNGEQKTLAPTLDAVARELGAGREAIELTRSRLEEIAASDAMRSIVAMKTVGREVPIYTRDRSGRVVEGRIDRLLIDDRGYVVLDYKSGTSDDTRLGEDREQVAAYCEHIRAMSGRDCRGLLWYIDTASNHLVEV